MIVGRCFNNRRYLTLASGLSLIEMLTALATGLLLVIGATTVFVSGRQSASLDDAVAKLHVHAQLALELIEDDVRMANYWGPTQDGANFLNKPSQLNATNPSTSLAMNAGADVCGTTHAVDIHRYIEATNNIYLLPDTCTPRSGVALTADTLTVRRAGIAQSELDATRLQVCTTRTDAEIILGTTCSGEVRDLIVNTYYVDRASSSGEAYPALRRKDLKTGKNPSGNAFRDIEMVVGVEDMQIQLGLLLAADSSHRVLFVNPDSELATSNEIVAVRAWVLLRSEEADPTHVDSKTYEYGDRIASNGITDNLDARNHATHAIKPNDNLRRLLVSRTFFVRNVPGTPRTEEYSAL
jgi:Tfp pilus assembly protein PilW